MARIIDISPIVSDRIAVWPGDVPYRREEGLSLAKGDNIGLSSIHTTVHVGAHADSPVHYVRDGRAISEAPLDHYYGACQVVQVNVPRGVRIRTSDLPVPIVAPRVLFRTGSFPDPEHFNEDFCSFSAELIEFLSGHDGLLAGIDTPSIDPFDDKGLESHQALARFGMSNLEGLVLSHVDPGLYTLAAFPLRIEGADASPVRAVLITGRVGPD